MRPGPHGPEHRVKHNTLAARKIVLEAVAGSCVGRGLAPLCAAACPCAHWLPGLRRRLAGFTGAPSTPAGIRQIPYGASCAGSRSRHDPDPDPGEGGEPASPCRKG